MKRPRKPFSRMTVTLPTFLIIGLREMVKGSEYTVSDLLTGWLTKTFSKKDLREITARSPEFRQAAKAWLEWEGEGRTRNASGTKR